MLRRRAIVKGFVFFAAVVLAGPNAARADDSADGAQRFIESMSDKAIAALAVNDISREERVRRFRLLLHNHFDVDTIGRWVLGRYWPRATKAERAEYLALFEKLIVATYVDRFTKYSGETLSVTKTAAKGDKDMMVFSRIVRPNGDPTVNVNWRVRMTKNGHRIVDVMVEGVSMGQTQRSEFNSVIRRHGGTVEGLLTELRKRAKTDA